MIDPSINQAIIQARESEALQRRIQEIGQGTVSALAQLPATEIVELSGSLLLNAAGVDGVTFTIHGPGNPRAYSITVPIDWLDQVHAAAHATQEAAAEKNGDGTPHEA